MLARAERLTGRIPSRLADPSARRIASPSSRSSQQFGGARTTFDHKPCRGTDLSSEDAKRIMYCRVGFEPFRGRALHTAQRQPERAEELSTTFRTYLVDPRLTVGLRKVY
jgi:hypothetical protein